MNMITIDFNTFWNEKDELKDSCIEYIYSILGPSEKTTISKDDNSPRGFK